jgi:DNA-binding transcriptional MerR regulator
MSKFQSKHVATIFDLPAATLRSWAVEFAPYLSPTATPGDNRHRYFTEDDLSVFALVKQMKADGMLFADIHASLQAGQRGELPPLPSDELLDVAASESGLALFNQFELLVNKVQQLEQRIEQRQTEEIDGLKAELAEAYKQIGRLEARLEMERQKKNTSE